METRGQPWELVFRGCPLKILETGSPIGLGLFSPLQCWGYKYKPTPTEKNLEQMLSSMFMEASKALRVLVGEEWNLLEFFTWSYGDFPPINLVWNMCPFLKAPLFYPFYCCKRGSFCLGGHWSWGIVLLEGCWVSCTDNCSGDHHVSV